MIRKAFNAFPATSLATVYLALLGCGSGEQGSTGAGGGVPAGGGAAGTAGAMLDSGTTGSGGTAGTTRGDSATGGDIHAVDAAAIGDASESGKATAIDAGRDVGIADVNGRADTASGADASRAADAGQGVVDGGSPPPFTGPTVTGTVTVSPALPLGHLADRFAGFSFEKSHMTDGFFTGTNAPLIGLFRLLGPGVVRIGANDVDNSVWQPNAVPVRGGSTTQNIGTADVDALAAFLQATGWNAIYGVAMRDSTPDAAVAEATYASMRLGSNLASLEIGNEINFYAGGIAVTRPRWETFADAIHASLPNAPIAAPATAGDINFTTSFTAADASRMVQVTHHYYRGAASSNPTLANLLPADPLVVTQSQQLMATTRSNNIRDGFRWGEMNSYSGHGAAGVSDVFGSALWGIDFMLTTAQYGAAGVNFHGGGQNMDGNVCSNGVASCTRPFRYSPIIEVDSQVTGAAPLFYGMLFVSRAGVGNMLTTRATAGTLNFTAYAIGLADGSTNVVLVNKDATSGVNANIDVGHVVGSATGLYLQAPSLNAATGMTFGGSGVTSTGEWNPKPAYALPVQAALVSVVVPPATAVLVHAD